METWEIINNYTRKQACWNLEALPLPLKHFYPGSQSLLLDCCWELMPPVFILLFLSWDLITLDSLLGHDHSLTHHNILSFKAKSEIHFLPLLTFAVGNDVSWNTSTHGCCSIWDVLCSRKIYMCPKIDISGVSLKNKLIIHKGHFFELMI